MAGGFEQGGTLWQRPAAPMGLAASRVLSRSVAQVVLAPPAGGPSTRPDGERLRAPGEPASREP